MRLKRRGFVFGPPSIQTGGLYSVQLSTVKLLTAISGKRIHKTHCESVWRLKPKRHL